MTEDAQPAAAPMEQQQGVEQVAASEVRSLDLSPVRARAATGGHPAVGRQPWAEGAVRSLRCESRAQVLCGAGAQGKP